MSDSQQQRDAAIGAILALEPTLQQLAEKYRAVVDVIDFCRRDAFKTGGMPSAEHVSTTISEERLARAIASRLRGLGMSQLLDLGGTIPHAGPEWGDDLTRAFDANRPLTASFLSGRRLSGVAVVDRTRADPLWRRSSLAHPSDTSLSASTRRP